MALIELVEKRADGDLVREMLAFAAVQIMEAEIEARTAQPRVHKRRCGRFSATDCIDVGVGCCGAQTLCERTEQLDGPVNYQSLLIYRQLIWTRLMHWIWAVCLLFLLLTGLQIFNAYPKLDIGNESGFEYDNSFFEIGARKVGEEVRGFTRVFGWELDTTGLLGVSSGEVRAFPAAVTIPSARGLARGRIIHFFFAWLLVGTLAVWLVASLLNGHFHQIWPRGRDLRRVGPDIMSHARLRFEHQRDYGELQKLTYAGVMLLFFP